MPPSPLLARITNSHEDIKLVNKAASEKYQVFLKEKLVEVEEAGKTVDCKCEGNSRLSKECSEVTFENEQMVHQVRKLQLQLDEAKSEEEKKRSSVSKLKGELCVTKSSREEEFPKIKESILLYKKVSGIKWAYSEDPCMVSGFVTDKSHGRLNPFTFNTRENSHSFILNSLWRNVEKYSKPFIVDDD